MKVLMITGDRRFGPGNERYELQRSAVDELDVVYWGTGALIPRIPWKKFDVVTAQDPFWRGHLARHLTRFVGGRLNIQVHTDLSAHPAWKRLFARMQLRRADTVRAVSEKIKQQVMDMAPGAKVFVLPVFIDIEPFRKIVRVPHEQKNILWVGRFEEEKNPMAAVEVAKKIPNAKLTMLGAGTLEAKLKQAAGGNVEFAPWQDPKPFLAKADVVVCTSWHESFGASIVEALAAGVPVVAPDVGVAREAGANVVPRNELASETAKVLAGGVQGKLVLQMPTAEEWKIRWRNTL